MQKAITKRCTRAFKVEIPKQKKNGRRRVIREVMESIYIYKKRETARDLGSRWFEAWFLSIRPLFLLRTTRARKTRFKATSLWRWKKRPSLSMRASVQYIFSFKVYRARYTLTCVRRKVERQNVYIPVCRDEMAKRERALAILRAPGA